MTSPTTPPRSVFWSAESAPEQTLVEAETRELAVEEEVRALFALDAREAATARQIAEAARLSPAGITGMLDELERDGIVLRERIGGLLDEL